MLDDGTEGESREVSQRAHDEHDTHEERGEGGCVRRKVRSTTSRSGFWRGRTAIARAAVSIIRKRPMSIASAMVVLYQGVLAVMPAKAEPLLAVAEA